MILNIRIDYEYRPKSNCKNWNLQFRGYKMHSFYIKHILSRVDSSKRHIWITKW